jgi:WD40 repeat protein
MDVVLQVLDREPPRPRALDRAVDRDLETICLKCLEKQPERRYASAAALADDLERWLRGEPILARRSGPAERLLKWARRRPAAAALAGVSALAAAAVAVALLVGAVLLNAKNAELTAQKGALTDKQGELEAALRRERDSRREEQRVFTAHRVFLADGQLRAGRPDEAEDLLDACRPADLRLWEWHYLKRLCHRDRATLRGASYEVSGVAFAPDGRRVAAAEDANKVYVWDVETGRRLLTLRAAAASTSFCRSVAFSRDGRLLATPTRRGAVVWDAETGKELHTLAWDDADGLPFDEGFANAVGFSPDGDRLVACGIDRVVRVWDLGREKEILRLEGAHEMAAFSPDGGTLVAAAADDKDGVRGYDAESGRRRWALPGAASCLAFRADGKQLAVGAARAPGFVRVYDVGGDAAPRLAREWPTEGRRVFGLAFRPGEPFLAGAVGDGVRVWDLTTGREAPAPDGGRRCVAYSPDGRWLAAGASENAVKVWDAGGPPRAWPADRPADGLTDLAFSPDGGLLALARQTGRVEEVELWDARREERLGVLSRREVPAGVEGEAGPVCLAFSPDGKRLAVGDGWRVFETTGDGKRVPREPDLTVWDAAGRRRLFAVERAGGRAAWSADGAWIATTTIRQNEYTPDAPYLHSDVRVWDSADGRPVRTLEEAGPHLAFSPAGRLLATAPERPGPRVRLWEVGTWRPVRDVKTRGLDCLAFSPDGKRLATAYESMTGVEVHDVETGRLLYTPVDRKGGAGLGGHGAYLAWSPDGRRLACVTDRTALRLWDAATGQEALALPASGASYGRLLFSPDGGRLAWLHGDGLTVWDGTPLPPERLYGRAARVRVKALFDRLLLKDEVLEALRKEEAPGEGFLDVARAALDEVEEDAARLDEVSWSVVSAPGADADDYRLALRQSEAACRLEPDNPDAVNTLAASCYRVGDDARALKELGRARGMRTAEAPDDFLLLALVRWRRGDKVQARADLDKARELMRRPEHKDDKQLQGLLHEAEATVGEER